MAEEPQIDFEDIREGDEIRVVRTSDAVTITVQGVAERQDEDGDWYSGIELLTYVDGHYDKEEYFLVKPGPLPLEPGRVVTFLSAHGKPVYAMKTYGDGEGWFTTFPDGSSALISDLYISRKDWSEV